MAVFTLLATAIGNALIAAGVNATIAASIGSIVVGATVTAVSNAFRSKPRSSPTPEYQVVVNQAAAPRKRGYGWAKVGGVRAFWDSKDGVLHQIVMCHTGLIESFETIYLGDTPVTVGGDGYVTSEPFDGLVGIATRRGGQDQLAYESMVAAWGVWTDDYRLRGIASIYARFESPSQEDFLKVFPEGAQTPVTAVAKLSVVEDPRTGDRVWSDNPALCIMDYLISDDGYPDTSRSDIYEPDFAAFADVCDALRPTLEGGYEPRYRLWGLYSLQDDPKAVLARMQATCDAEIYERPDGLIGIRGGEWTRPTVKLTERDILSFDLEQGSDRFATFNELKTIYTDREQDFQPTEAPRWRNMEDQARRGPIVEELVLDMVPSSRQAQQLAQIYERKKNPEWRGTIQTTLVGLKARGERVIRLVIPELAIDGTFGVESHGIAGDLTGCELSVYSLDQTAYDTVIEEEASEPPADTRPGLTLEVPNITLLTIEAGPVIKATVADPERKNLELQGQWRNASDTDWEPMTISSNDRNARTPTVSTGESYNVRARWKSARGAASEWSSSTLTINIPS